MCKSNLQKIGSLIMVTTNKVLCKAIYLSKVPSTLFSTLKVEFNAKFTLFCVVRARVSKQS